MMENKSVSTTNECCAVCKYHYPLVKFDYSHGGCIHKDKKGFICMAFSEENEAIWMYGISPHRGLCEMFSRKRGKQNG